MKRVISYQLSVIRVHLRSSAAKFLFVLVLASLFPRSALSQVWSDTIFVGDVSTQEWQAVTGISAVVTNGGYYTNTAVTYTNTYRISATNLAGRIPLSTNISVVFTPNATLSNAVYVAWTRHGGINRHVIEKSYDAGATWTNWLTLSPSTVSWTDTGSNTWTTNIFTNAVSAIPGQTVPWGLPSSDAGHSMTAQGGFQGGTNATATSGGAIGYGATATTGGAVGTNAVTTSGGAVGQDSVSTTGGAVGFAATSTEGGATGSGATATTGGSAGLSANTEDGGAIGENSGSSGGGAVGHSASTTSGGAAGSNAVSTTGGAIGESAVATAGGAVGVGANTVLGGSVGQGSRSTNGAALGMGAGADSGGAVGSVAYARSGGGVGANAVAWSGGAVGNAATTTSGGAIGEGASAVSGGAVGLNAKTAEGFAGGWLARTTVDGTSTGAPIDAIQLGSGGNSNIGTLQVYAYPVLDSSGNIVSGRVAWVMTSVTNETALRILGDIPGTNAQQRVGLVEAEVDVLQTNVPSMTPLTTFNSLAGLVTNSYYAPYVIAYASSTSISAVNGKYQEYRPTGVSTNYLVSQATNLGWLFWIDITAGANSTTWTGTVALASNFAVTNSGTTRIGVWQPKGQNTNYLYSVNR